MILETKDWRLDTIQQASRGDCLIAPDGVTKSVPNPIEQARHQALQVVDALKRDAQLIQHEGKWKGMLTLPQPLQASNSLADKAIGPIPLVPKSGRPKSVDQILSLMLRDFAEAGKPRTLSALERRIQSRFVPEPVPEKVASVKAALVMKGAIKIADGTVEYKDRGDQI